MGRNEEDNQAGFNAGESTNCAARKDKLSTTTLADIATKVDTRIRGAEVIKG